MVNKTQMLNINGAQEMLNQQDNKDSNNKAKKAQFISSIMLKLQPNLVTEGKDRDNNKLGNNQDKGKNNKIAGKGKAKSMEDGKVEKDIISMVSNSMGTSTDTSTDIISTGMGTNKDMEDGINNSDKYRINNFDKYILHSYITFIV